MPLSTLNIIELQYICMYGAEYAVIIIERKAATFSRLENCRRVGNSSLLVNGGVSP
jgi:hypothetical protein